MQLDCYRNRELFSAQRSCAVDSNFCIRSMQLCRTKLCSLIAIAIESYFPHNEVVRLIVISAYEVCSSAEQSCAVTGYFLLALCAGGNLVESRGFFHLSSKQVRVVKSRGFYLRYKNKNLTSSLPPTRSRTSVTRCRCNRRLAVCPEKFKRKGTHNQDFCRGSAI